MSYENLSLDLIKMYGTKSELKTGNTGAVLRTAWGPS